MKVFQIIKSAISDFIDDEALTLAAALAFYATLSLSPILVILLAVGGLAGEETQKQMITQIQTMVGPQASQMVNVIMQHLHQNFKAGLISAIIGIITILISASGLVGQLQYSLNQIWDVPAKSGGIKRLLKKRLLSLIIVLATAILLLASLAVSAILDFILPSDQPGWKYVDLGISITVFAMLFAMLFKYLPDIEIHWRFVWPGAFITAILFAVGKYGIGLYLGHSSVASAYGAAGSLIILLLWIYYSSIILFFGAELTQAYSAHTTASETDSTIPSGDI